VALAIQADFPHEADLARFVEERLRRSPAATRRPAHA
jgi:hypothetical protein